MEGCASETMIWIWALIELLDCVKLILFKYINKILHFLDCDLAFRFLLHLLQTFYIRIYSLFWLGISRYCNLKFFLFFWPTLRFFHSFIIIFALRALITWWGARTFARRFLALSAFPFFSQLKELIVYCRYFSRILILPFFKLFDACINRVELFYNRGRVLFENSRHACE